MRTLLELFKLLKNSKKIYDNRRCNGLCRLCDILTYTEVITHAEYNILHKYIIKHKPKPKSIHYDPSMEGTFWYWKRNQWTPRELWIDAQIKKLSKKE